MSRGPIRVATNADVSIEVHDGKEAIVAHAFLSASFYCSIQTAEATLTLAPPKIPPILGKTAISLPVELPFTIRLNEAKFTRMHELNCRRAEINLNFYTGHKNVHVTLTTNAYQDGLQAEMLDEIYFKALMWYKSFYMNSIDDNQHAYYRMRGDSAQVDTVALLGKENERLKRTFRAINKYPKPEPPIIRPMRRIYDRLLALDDLAKATIVALANLKPFKEFVQFLCEDASADVAPITMQLFECFNDMPHINPTPQLLAVLKKTNDGTALGMVEQLCKTLDTEAKAHGLNVKSDRPFVLRVVNKIRCARCGRAPPISAGPRMLTKGINETPLRRPFILLRPKLANENDVATPVSLLQALKETLQNIVGDEKEKCERCNDFRSVSPVGMVTDKLPNALLFGVMRGAALKSEVVLDEPEWLVLDKLIESGFNADGERDLRRTNMSITLPAIAYHAAKKAADEGCALPRKATYQLVSVVRQWNGVSGAEIHDDGQIVRFADGKELEKSYRKPNDTEMRCTRLLVYERVGGPESSAMDSDNEEILRTSKRTQQVELSQPGVQRRQTHTRNWDHTPPPKATVSAETAAKLEAEMEALEQAALMSSAEEMEVDEPVVKQTRKSRRVGAASDRRKSVEATVSPPARRRSRRRKSNSDAGGSAAVERSKSRKKIVRPRRNAAKK